MDQDNDPVWHHRLTKAEAVNFFIAAMILHGNDPEGELVIDGDPGNYLMEAARELDLPANFGDFDPVTRYAVRKGPAMPASRLCAVHNMVGIAKLIGYKGSTIAGIVEYLRSFPESGPIGGTPTA